MSAPRALFAWLASALLASALGCGDDPLEGRADLRERCGLDPRPAARCGRLPDRGARKRCESDDLADAECALDDPEAYCRAQRAPTEERRRGDNPYIACVDEAIAPTL